MKILSIALALLALGCSQKTPDSTDRKLPPRHGPHRPFRPAGPIKKNVCELKPAVVAVIDTGFKFSDKTAEAKLCKFGHKNFSSITDSYLPPNMQAPVPVDNHGHGTNVAGIIQEFAGNTHYCIVVIKYFDPNSKVDNNLENTIKAIRYANNIGAKYINYSGGGLLFDEREKIEVEKFLDRGGRFIAAAGNEKSDISEKPYYPAMYDERIVSVGSIEEDGTIAKYSNFGDRVSRWEYGTNIVGFGISMSGTSQATATATGKIINEQECGK
jgi:subtilisin family serine protease